MKEVIQSFIAQKQLSTNSSQAYFYDLNQFWEQVQPVINDQSLLLYQQFLTGLQPSVQQRKSSAINQFLYYLYETEYLDRFYKVKKVAKARISREKRKRVDLDSLWQSTELLEGQLIALFISQLGLTPSEIAQIKTEQIDMELRIVSLEKKGQKRILSLPQRLVPYLHHFQAATFLFDKKGQAYSRQWFFKQLSKYVEQLGQPNWTAQFLREQFILKQLDSGMSREELAKQLGLKTRMTLEKYI